MIPLMSVRKHSSSTGKQVVRFKLYVRTYSNSFSQEVVHPLRINLRLSCTKGSLSIFALESSVRSRRMWAPTSKTLLQHESSEQWQPNQQKGRGLDPTGSKRALVEGNDGRALQP